MTAPATATAAATMPKTHISKLAIPHKHLLSIEHLAPSDIQAILDLSEFYVVQNRRRSQANLLLKGMVMMNVFLENSTRTRLSFEMAAKRLGADVINMGVEGSSMKKGESFHDTLKTLNAMRPDIFVLRHCEEGAAEGASQIFDCPVLNAGDGTREHPTQALLDALTLRRHFGKLEGLTVTILGDVLHSRVAHSNLSLFKKMGVNVKCLGPAELMPLAAGGTQDMKEGLSDADAIMVLRIQKERLHNPLPFTDAEYFRQYGLTAERLAHARKGAVILHPGPMNRDVEIDAAIADDPQRSMVTTQVEMGVAVRMACLDLLTRGAR